MVEPIIIPLRAVHLATEGHGPSQQRTAVLEPEADRGMSMLEVDADDFEDQVRPLLLEWFDEQDLDSSSLEECIDALATLPGRRLMIAVHPGGGWEISFESTQGRPPLRFARLDRRSTRRSTPKVERRVSVPSLPTSGVPVLDVSDDGSGLALDCDSNELRALLMEGALREPGAHAIEIQVVRVQALGEGRFRVGCVVGRGQETARNLLS